MSTTPARPAIRPIAPGHAPHALVAALAVLALALALLVAAPAEAKRPTRGSVSWGDTSLTSSAGGYAVKGRVSGGRGRAVQLQVRWADGWHLLDRARTRAGGRFTIKGRLGWLGSHPVRVNVPPTRGFRAKRFGPRTFTVKRLWSARGRSSAHVFFTYPYNGRDLNFAWNPCRTIRYRVNPGRAGNRAIPFTQEGVRRIAAATGVRFRYVGRTDKFPITGPRYPRGTDLIVAWSHERNHPGLEGAVGVGGFQSGRLAKRRAGTSRVWQIGSPGVTMNMAHAGSYPWAFASTENEPMGLVLIHELGHAMGLMHYADNIQIMHPGDRPARGNRWSALWEKGDLTGLRKVGAQPGCLQLVRGRGAPTAPGQELE